MKPRAAERPPATLLLLLLAALLSGCQASPVVPAGANEGNPSTTSETTLGQAIPVTGFGLEVVSCDPRGTYINFRLSDLLSGDTSARLQVQFNGRAGQCSHPLGDPAILSCSIPALSMFPLLVEVRLDDLLISQFSYDGSLCPLGVHEEAAESAYPPAVLTASATAAGLSATSSGGGPTGSSLTAMPTSTAQPPSVQPPPPQPSATEPPPPTQPQPTQPPSTEPPPTQPPPTEPPATQPPPATQKPTPTHKPSPTPKPPPTPKPSPTPRPPHPTEPPPTEPPPTQPPQPTEAPTQSGLNMNFCSVRLAYMPGQGPVPV